MAKIEFHADGLKENEFVDIKFDSSGVEVIVGDCTNASATSCCLSWFEWRTLMRMLRGYDMAEGVLQEDPEDD